MTTLPSPPDTPIKFSKPPYWLLWIAAGLLLLVTVAKIARPFIDKYENDTFIAEGGPSRTYHGQRNFDHCEDMGKLHHLPEMAAWSCDARIKP